jgi:hypothetical protein
MRVRYKGVSAVEVKKGNIVVVFAPGEEKDIPDDLGEDLITMSVYEKVENKPKFLKNEGGE